MEFRIFRLRALFLTLALIALAACDDAGTQNQQGPGGGQPPPRVTVATVDRTSVDEVVVYAGRARGAREVEIRAQVEGILQERLYNEGQYVEQGEALFRIEPAPFEAELRSAQAERQNAQAELNQAQREWDRVSGLYQDNAVSARERDQAQSALELAQAAVALADAAVMRARINLDYTEVDAPLAGVTGLETLPEGSLVRPGDLLTTVTELDTIHVRFSLPESDARAHRTARRAMVDREGDHTRDVELLLPDGELYGHTGVVDFTDATIDQRTGSVSARALFDNPDHDLVPGQFVRVRLVLQTLDEVVLVPEEAVGQRRDSARVFVVDEDGVAHAREVELGPVVADGQVVLSGLDGGERVVINGQVGLRDGQEVELPRDDQEDDG